MITKTKIIEQAKRIQKSAGNNPFGSLAETREFLHTYAGPKNHFEQALAQLTVKSNSNETTLAVERILNAFLDYVNNDLLRTISMQREIQIDTVSDYLEQARILLDDNRVHPAVPAVIIGASLEEFLRNWLEETGFDLNTIKNTLEPYTQELKKANLINKQDMKDITSWAGLRNDAAHGHWDKVKDRDRIVIFLESVNNFMRKYGQP